eukprot:TRINITY_DN6975_c0_g2_i1.p1 TRINITY_DN6975_c0_g2~~TRINITY_DN6975_c0_g2_i1.p1  ORF type:complete len:809 (+),score=182.08 TRINITY_DN6975_c0_g2_i1:100-2526(+)
MAAGASGGGGERSNEVPGRHCWAYWRTLDGEVTELGEAWWAPVTGGADAARAEGRVAPKVLRVTATNELAAGDFELTERLQNGAPVWARRAAAPAESPASGGGSSGGGGGGSGSGGVDSHRHWDPEGADEEEGAFDGWLFSTPMGHWAVTCRQEHFSREAGVLRSSHAHCGALPHHVDGWEHAPTAEDAAASVAALQGPAEGGDCVVLQVTALHRLHRSSGLYFCTCGEAERVGLQWGQMEWQARHGGRIRAAQDGCWELLWDGVPVARSARPHRGTPPHLIPWGWETPTAKEAADDPWGDAEDTKVSIEIEAEAWLPERSAASDVPQRVLTCGWLPAVQVQEESDSDSDGDSDDDGDGDEKDDEGDGSEGSAAAAPDPPEDRVTVEVRARLWASRRGWLLDLGREAVHRLRLPRSRIAEGPRPPDSRRDWLLLRCPDISNNDCGSIADGGWGPPGQVNSTKYVKRLLDAVWDIAQTEVSAESLFIRKSSQVQAAAGWAREGQAPQRCVLVHLWPTDLEDDPDNPVAYCGYVRRDALMALLDEFDKEGISCAFPHPLPLYRMLVSKSWLVEGLEVGEDLARPRTVRVSREDLLALGATGAAEEAVAALDRLGYDGPGVAKMGYSWEGRGIKVWRETRELVAHLDQLFDDYPCAEAVYVQEFVPHCCEMRCFCIDGTPAGALLYTKFMKDGLASPGVGEFAARPRDEALAAFFGGNEALLSAREDAVRAAAAGWVRRIGDVHGHTAVLRFDFFVSLEDGERSVVLNELTECGASTMLWAEGPQVTARAAARFALRAGGPRTPLTCGAAR